MAAKQGKEYRGEDAILERIKSYHNGMLETDKDWNAACDVVANALEEEGLVTSAQAARDWKQ